MDLNKQRRAIRHLLNEYQPADAIAAYYAFYHPPEKTRLVLYPPDSAHVTGYMAFAQTGFDLFRPFVTLRLPHRDLHGSVELVHNAILPGTAVILHTPDNYLPLLQALFQIHSQETLALYKLEASRFRPILNVLVTQSTGTNGLPRFVIRRTTTEQDEIVAAAGINWQTPYFAEISVYTAPKYRRRGWGRSVVSAMAQHLLENGRIPLYAVATTNTPSIHLAQALGFTDTGVRQILLQATLKPRP